jgi:hypothetical protein
MTFDGLVAILKSRGCKSMYAKRLSSNDNSKNQVYLGGSFDILNILPLADVKSESSGDWKRERFKAQINFSWILESGSLANAPFAQLILYPKYPEVRFSGFLKGCSEAPSGLMAVRLEGRYLCFGVTEDRTLIGFVFSPEDEASRQLEKQSWDGSVGVFQYLELDRQTNSRSILLAELQRIHNKGWIESKRLDSQGQILDCNAPNCGGYTLEAELGVRPNGIAQPDFLGWEIKQYGVARFGLEKSVVMTLMTPEPNGGLYCEQGVESFVRVYGYPDKKGRKDRLNFGGIHKVGIPHPTTRLTMQLIGFDVNEGKIRNAGGQIALVNSHGEQVASWSFSSMLLHWNKKHKQACYVPSVSENIPTRRYHFGSQVKLGIGTDFSLFLKEMASGKVFYDPGIKLENESTNPRVKRRSQFRIAVKHLSDLYQNFEVIELE